MLYTVRCPICSRRFAADLDSREARERDAAQRFFPFCSERCRAVDLGRWVDEEYRISQPLLPRPETEVEPGEDA